MQTVILVLRNLGAQWLGAYGNEWVATPHLDALAAIGTVYDRHFAVDLHSPKLPWESRSVARLSEAVGLVNATDDVVIACEDLAWPWHFRDDVFESYCEGIDETLTPWREPLPERVTEDDWDRLHFSFAAAVTQLDAAVGKLFSRIEVSQTRLLITSDTGFPLGEHGVVGPAGSALHDELIHLPLIVVTPGAAADRVTAITTPADLPAILSGQAEVRDAVVSRAGGRVSVRRADWALLKDDESIRLYQKPADVWNANDVAREHPAVIEDLLTLVS
jgi:hypothetical protein